MTGINIIATGYQIKIVVSACMHIEFSQPSLLKEILIIIYSVDIVCPTCTARAASHYQIIMEIMMLVKSPDKCSKLYVFKVIIRLVFKIINSYMYIEMTSTTLDCELFRFLIILLGKNIYSFLASYLEQLL